MKTMLLGISLMLFGGLTSNHIPELSILVIFAGLAVVLVGYLTKDRT